MKIEASLDDKSVTAQTQGTIKTTRTVTRKVKKKRKKRKNADSALNSATRVQEGEYPTNTPPTESNIKV